MKKYSIEFSKEAKKDLIDIYSYIKYNLQDDNNTNNFIENLKSEINDLKEYPTSHPIVDYDLIRRLKIRKIIVNDYIVFYIVDDDKDKVQIVRIMYGKQNWLELI